MALINHAKREINAKIVYFGCEGAGKSTSMKYIFDRIKPSLRGELKTLPTSGGSLLFFDFSPFEAPVFGGYRVRFHIYTLPGKVVNPAAWKMTLKGADGLVVVADSAPGKVSAARASILNLREFLAAYGLGLNEIPTVLQHNSSGRDRTVSLDEASAILDLPGIPVCQSEATSGEGVLETLTMLSRAIMGRIGKDESLLKVNEPVASIEDHTQEESDGIHTDGNESGRTNDVTAPDSSEKVPVRIYEEELTVRQIDSRLDDQFQVSLAGDSAMCLDGVVRIPLELNIGGESRRFVVSIAIEQA